MTHRPKRRHNRLRIGRTTGNKPRRPVAATADADAVHRLPLPALPDKKVRQRIQFAVVVQPLRAWMAFA